MISKKTYEITFQINYISSENMSVSAVSKAQLALPKSSSNLKMSFKMKQNERDYSQPNENTEYDM